MRRKRILRRVGAAVRRAAWKAGTRARVLLDSGRVVELDGALVPSVDAEGVSVGAIGTKGVWVFPFEDWAKVAVLLGAESSSAFSISNGEAVWAPDFGTPVVVAPELGVVRVSCLRVIGRRG